MDFKFKEEADNMTQAELVLWLTTLKGYIGATAKTVEEATDIIQKQIDELKK